MPTRRSPAPLSEFTEAPLLRALKGGRIGVSVKGGQAKPLADALTSVSNALAKATTASERNRLTSIQKILTALQTQAETLLRQLPPTERGLASLGKAAALKREKRAVEDPKNPSGHFVKRLDPSEMSPADAAAARSRRAQQAEMEQKYGKFRGRQIFDLPSVQPMKRLNPREAAAIGTAARSRQGPPEQGERPKRRLVAGSEYARRLMSEGLKKKEVAAIRPEPLSTPEEYLRRRLAEGRLYRESLAGSPDRPSAIENLQPERFGELRQEAAKIVRQAGDRPAQATAKSVRQYNVTVQKAVKAGEISKDLGNTLRNRLIESIMTSGSGDAVLGALSSLGGKTRYQTKRGLVRERPYGKITLVPPPKPEPRQPKPKPRRAAVGRIPASPTKKIEIARPAPPPPQREPEVMQDYPRQQAQKASASLQEVMQKFKKRVHPLDWERFIIDLWKQNQATKQNAPRPARPQ